MTDAEHLPADLDVELLDNPCSEAHNVLGIYNKTLDFYYPDEYE